MKTLSVILRPFLVLQAQLRRAGPCASIGIVAGAVTGFFLTLLWLSKGGDPLADPADALAAAALLAAVSWGVALFLLVALVRYGLGAVLRPTLLNTVLVAFATVAVTVGLGRYELAGVIGVILGFLIGAALCALHRRWGEKR